MKEYINRHCFNLDMRFEQDNRIHQDLVNFRSFGGGRFRTKEQYIKFCMTYAKEHYFDLEGNNEGITMGQLLKKVEELEKKVEGQHLIMLKEIGMLAEGKLQRTGEGDAGARPAQEISREMLELAKMWG